MSERFTGPAWTTRGRECGLSPAPGFACRLDGVGRQFRHDHCSPWGCPERDLALRVRRRSRSMGTDSPDAKAGLGPPDAALSAQGTWSTSSVLSTYASPDTSLACRPHNEHCLPTRSLAPILTVASKRD